jgi:hypothetical protein
MTAVLCLDLCPVPLYPVLACPVQAGASLDDDGATAPVNDVRVGMDGWSRRGGRCSVGSTLCRMQQCSQDSKMAE